MKNALIFLFLALASSVAAGEPADPRLERLAREQLGKDFRVVFTFQKDVFICGAQGDAYTGEVEMNKPRPEAGSDNTVRLVDDWVKIGKTYSIFADELETGRPGLMDSGNCLE